MMVRPASPADAAGMTTVLNDIIALGGTTAHQTPFDAAKMLSHYIAGPKTISCQIAEEASKVIGFQWLGWADAGETPKDWAIIASFVSGDAAGKGVGQHLFGATKAAAIHANVPTIDATIRADNTPGLRYYSGLGFVDYNRLVDVPLSDGTHIDRICKRFDLPKA